MVLPYKGRSRKLVRNFVILRKQIENVNIKSQTGVRNYVDDLQWIDNNQIEITDEIF